MINLHFKKNLLAYNYPCRYYKWYKIDNNKIQILYSYFTIRRFYDLTIKLN